MGLLSRLFRKDPVTLLESGEQSLASGDALKALHIAEDVLKTAAPGLQGRARDLEAAAREAFTTSALEKALRAREAHLPEEAVQWLETALSHCRDEAQRQQIETLLEADRQRVEELENAPFPETVRAAGGEEEDLDEEEDGEYGAYEILLEILADEVAPLYERRPPAFQQAYVALSAGHPDQALVLLDTLVEEEPGDPVLRLERGRSHLFLGHFEAAVADLELAWPEFEDEPLDRLEETSVTLLWSEAQMALGHPDLVADRLEPLTDPAENRPRISSLYAQALIESGQLEEALHFLSEAVEWYAAPSFRLQIGQCLEGLSQPERAIDIYEGVIAPACRTGCESSPLERPAARALIGLYMDGGRDPKRAAVVAELLEMDLRRGAVQEDLETLVTYYRQVGNGERVAELEEGLSRAGEAGLLSEPQAPSVLRTATKAL